MIRFRKVAARPSAEQGSESIFGLNSYEFGYKYPLPLNPLASILAKGVRSFYPLPNISSISIFGSPEQMYTTISNVHSSPYPYAPTGYHHNISAIGMYDAPDSEIDYSFTPSGESWYSSAYNDVRNHVVLERAESVASDTSNSTQPSRESSASPKASPKSSTTTPHAWIQRSQVTTSKSLSHLVVEFSNNGVKSFFCGWAGCKHPVGFAQKPQLITHIRSVHLQEKPFICTTCNTQFSRKQEASRHVVSMNTGRKYKCSGCHQAFSRKNYRDAHEEICMYEEPTSRNTQPSTY